MEHCTNNYRCQINQNCVCICDNCVELKAYYKASNICPTCKQPQTQYTIPQQSQYTTSYPILPAGSPMIWWCTICCVYHSSSFRCMNNTYYCVPKAIDSGYVLTYFS